MACKGSEVHVLLGTDKVSPGSLIDLLRRWLAATQSLWVVSGHSGHPAWAG
jgi:hypothetical protein